MAEFSEHEKFIPEAKTIYVLMQNEYRVSRNIRAQWFLNHLNKVVKVIPKQSKEDCHEEIEIISAIPKNPSALTKYCDQEYDVRIVPGTKVIFLATRYRLVFCLDLSPSVATVDVQNGVIFFDEIYPTLKKSLERVCEPFIVPGSHFSFVPQLHLTIIAHIPNCPSGVPQVLIQGWMLMSDNVSCLLEKIKNSMCKVTERVAKAISKSNEEFDKFRVSPECLSASFVKEGHDNINSASSKAIKIPHHVLTSEISTVNLLRYGILALQLLPENSSAGIVVITDGVVGFPCTRQNHMQDDLLAHLRNSTISCSFLQIGSPYHPSACFGRIPYVELMQFISAATCGAYFSSVIETMRATISSEPNEYHKAFLFWSFQTTQTPDFLEDHEPFGMNQPYWSVDNPHFYSVAKQSRVRKKHISGAVDVSLENLLSCRLREGYTVKSVHIDEGKNVIEVRLHLSWNLSTNFEYVIRSNLNNANQCHENAMECPKQSSMFELIVDGCYEFLHDVTCSDKKPIKSCYRASVIDQFWTYVRTLSHTDQILVQLHSFTRNPAHYVVPESIKNGVPLFYPPINNNSPPVLANKNMTHSQFTSFWKPFSMLNINVWQKWMHTHRIGIILQHDMPLPKNLHLPNASGRYVHIQYRQAMTAVYSLLSDFSSFVLVENQFYIKFLFDEPDKPPSSFYMIRVISKSSCMVIRLAFLGGLPGFQRNEIVKDVQERILSLRLHKRPTSKDHSSQLSDSSSGQSESCDMKCCFLLRKPVEKILIKYESLPKNYMTSIVDCHIVSSSRSRATYQLTSEVFTNMLITLSKYLHHQRWVWSMQRGPNTSLSMSIVSKILSILTKIRLKEGFHFSHSNFGIMHMVLEVPMKLPSNEAECDEENNEKSSCVVQYLLFPPHTNTTFKDSVSEEEDSELPESDGELQLITECWVEPQYGVTSTTTELRGLSGITYEQISQAIFAEDSQCISILTTFEHLCQLCQKKESTDPCQVQSSASTTTNDLKHSQVNISPSVLQRMPSQATPPLHSLSSNINFVPYSFSLTKLLPKCHQTKLLFPTLHICDVERENIDENIDPLSEPNELLFEYLISNIKLAQDQELLLSVQDSVKFLHQAYKRNYGLDDVMSMPASLLQYADFLSTNAQQCSTNAKSSIKENQLVTSMNSSIVPKWRCFVKGCSKSRFLITLLPASYSDLHLLTAKNTEPNASTASTSKNSQVYSESCIKVSGSLSKKCDSGEIVLKAKNLEQISDKDTNVDSPVLRIPVYIYDCILASVVNQLSDPDNTVESVDYSESYNFKYEDNSLTLDEVLPENTDFVMEPVKRPKRKSSKAFLNSHRSLLDKSFSKSFVYAVYRSLILNAPVRKTDVVAAIDEICEESFLEVDITDYMFTICAHVNDFTMKHSIKQIHFATEKENRSDSIEGGEEPVENNEKSPQKTLFPLEILKKHQPCEQLFQKHLNIKSRFTEVLAGFLKTIPSRPDYYVFQPAQDSDEASVNDDPFPDVENQDTVTELAKNPILEKNEKDTSNHGGIPEEVLSLNSHGNTQSSISSLDDDPDSSFSEKQSLWPPLFVQLLCSVKTKDDIGSCSVPTLPTCLKEIRNCMNPKCTEIDLDDVRITLDVTCLTLPSDIQNPAVPEEGQYSTSYSSSSPVPEPEPKKSITPDDDEALSDVETDAVQSCPLRNIPVFQREGVYKCISRIKWLLADEKASAALDSYPITSSTLEFVANHIKYAEDKLCCVVKEVPLNFVYGPETSVEKFIQVFKLMTLPGYRLNQIDDFFYLVLDAESAQKLNKPFGSLDPPLAKYELMRCSLHHNDSTELKNICEEAEKHKVARNVELSTIDDDTRSFELHYPPSKHKLSVNAMREKRRFRKSCKEEDTETEDGNEHFELKIRSRQKSVSRTVLSPSLLRKRFCSLPSSFTPSSVIPPRHAYSLPSILQKMEHENEFTKTKEDEKSDTLETSNVGSDLTWKTSPNVYGRLSPDRYMDWGSEIPTSSAIWNSPLDLKTDHSTSNAPSAVKNRVPESVGSPPVCSDVDYGSTFGSCHFSNTEDGYDGDSSDSGSDCDWMSALDTKRPILPKFWMIMTVDTSKVTIYFHIRYRKKEDEELLQSKVVLSQTVTVIKNICKEVNQALLLQSLHETKRCNQLLVPEENDDIWKKNDSDPISRSSNLQRISVDEGNSIADQQDKYLEANLRFMPGAFNCDVVWDTHFRLHHRLTSSQNGSFLSRGVQTLRTVLNTFAVNNRENMFVYQERSGSVFYLRLHEEICEEDHSVGKPKMEGSLSPSGSCYSSGQAAFSRKLCIENENDCDFRPRVNSGLSDSDRQDTVSNVSMSKNVQKCIALYVHGIGEVGNEIKVDLVQALQNRLNEGVLDRIILMLTRNPLCKLTPEDVQFIQNPNQPPFKELHFTIPVKLLDHAHAIHIFLRQNMLHFLYNPKYMDSSRKDYHFKAYSKNSFEPIQVDDNDIFLYHSQSASGYSGSKGIACVVLMIVTGQGIQFQHLNHSLPNPTAYQDGLSENDFEELTLTCKYVKKDRTPGPVALIRFQIWNVGKDSIEHIEEKLRDTVRHTFWDLLMEYKVLTAPISEAVIYDDPSSYSEPTTPIRTRRTGRLAVEQSLKLKDSASPFILQSSKEMSSSVPDIAAKSQSPQCILGDVSAFPFSTGPKSARAELCSGPLTPDTTDSQSQEGSKSNLNYMFHSVLKSFLDFGHKLGCPTVSKHTFHLSSRHSVELVLQETHNILKGICRGQGSLNMRIFLRKTNVLDADTNFVPFTIHSSSAECVEETVPGAKRSFIITGRNDQQWKAYMRIIDFLKFQETYADALKDYQRYTTHVCRFSSSSERYQESTPNSPTSVGCLDTIATPSTPRLKSPPNSILDSHSPQSSSSSSVLFVPRQRLLLMFMQDKELTVFLYNWSQDLTKSFLKEVEKLVHWHDFRDALLSNIVVQKLGLFHGQTFPKRVEKKGRSDKTELARKTSDMPFVITWNIVEQLFQLHSLPRETHSSSSASAKPSTVHSSVPAVLEIMKNTRPPVPLHASKYSAFKDPVTKHGMQIVDIRNAYRRDMPELHSVWQTRGPNLQNDSMEKLLLLLKRFSRLSHYCLTPLLFSPSWRWKVAPVRDHTLRPLESAGSILDKSPSDSSLLSRSRHSSGSSLKNESGQSTSSTSRSRRTSGATVPISNQGSPKPRIKNPSEETWHQTVCNHYLKEYIQYLHTLGFVPLQTKEESRSQGSRKTTSNEDTKYAKIAHARTGLWAAPVFYLIRRHLGGLLLFEIGLCDPYAYAHLYTIECSRLCVNSPRGLISQFTCAFLDEVDKIKAVMHLHSFTYDYHLRTIHSYISGRQLIFRHGYHLTSFLDDFIKYYQKSPNCARNLLYAGSITINDISMSGHQLYNYIISHNQLYGMTVLRMVPIMQDSSSMMDTEFVLVELTSRKASYKDTNDVCQMGSFDIGLLINHNTSEISTDRNTLSLNYYIILTSQRELFPIVENYSKVLGSFQTVRFAAVYQPSSASSSRKTSATSTGTDKDKFESSGEETSSSSTDSRSRKSASTLGITDEEVTYLGYFSNQETMMQEVLLREAKSSQTHLGGVFHRAAIHCRRDFLWSSLLPRSTKEEESSKDTHLSSMSYAEFSELLNLVSPVPLDYIDPNLRTFLDMHISWYKALVLSLKTKYPNSHREFRDPDQNMLYIAVTNNRCPDSFMLLSIDYKLSRAELCVVFREHPSGTDHTPDKPSPRILALQSLVEEFVNTCCFQMWGSIISS